MWDVTDTVWNTYVDGVDTSRYRSQWRALVALLLASRGREFLILRGSVSFADRYRDLLLALLVKLLPRRPRILIADATWETGSDALESRAPVVARLLPRISRLVIRLIDGPHVRYGVLSTAERDSFHRTWPVDPDRVVFTPFHHTVYDDGPVHDGGYVFAGGNSLRDYELLEEAARGLDVPVRVAARWQPRADSGIVAGPTSHEDFMALLRGARVVVVTLRPSIRSAGQQTYLNAMALGKPVIVTAAPGVGDYVRDGRDAVVVEPTPAALRAAIADLMSPAAAERRARLGLAGQERALGRFSTFRYRERLLAAAGVRVGGSADSADRGHPGPGAGIMG